ncbi:MAG: MATE family efflux transporter [Dehalococcoidia bacterium]
MKTDKPDELEETTARLGTERLSKLLLRLSAPSIASMITISLYHLADTFWLGQVSYQAIAAVTVTFPFYIAVVAIGVGTGVGANALASRRFGERNIETTNQVAGQVFPLTAIFGVVFIIVSVFFARQLAALLGAPQDIVALTAEYLVFFGWGIPFILFQLMTRNVFHAAGDVIKPMIFIVAGSVINAVLDPFLIFGWGPFPEMGIGGAALATTISGGLAAALSCYYLLGNKSVYRLKLHHLRPNLSIMAQIYRVGLPSILMELTETIVFILFLRIVAGFGSITLAALGIAIRIADLAFRPIIGVAHGLLPIVGFCLGARLWERLWSAVRQASLALVVMLSVATVFLEIFTPQIIAIFNNDPELLAIAVPGIRIFISTLILIGPAIMFITTFQGLSKGWTATSLSLVRELVFFIPAILILPRFMGLNGVWLSLPIADVCGTAIAGFWLYREYRLQKRSGIWDNVPATEPIPESVPRGRSTLD